MSNKNYTQSSFSPDDTALALIDRQAGIMQLVQLRSFHAANV